MDILTCQMINFDGTGVPDNNLVGQDNLRRYLPVHDLRIRIHPADTAFDIFTREEEEPSLFHTV